MNYVDKLQGTLVVSLADFTDNDYKKDKYGRTVPKKLKKDDPRIKVIEDVLIEEYGKRLVADYYSADAIKAD